MQDNRLAEAPLAGIKVVDLTQIYNGPYATFLMAAAGARIIKVEPPGGEMLRRRSTLEGASLPFAMLNGMKESVVLDLKTEEGNDAIHSLLADADVIVENFACGVMERLGLGAETLQARYPKLIYASSSGYGNDGPYRDYLAMDLTVQAMTGIMHSTGFPENPPVKAGPALCDFFAGVHLYGGIVTALLKRDRTGIAHRVEVTMQDAVYPSLASSLGLQYGLELSGTPPELAPPPRTGNRHGGLAEAPYNVYPCADGFIAIFCANDSHWHAVARTIGREDLIEDPRFRTRNDRVASIDALDALIGDWTMQHNRDELFSLFLRNRVPSAPVRDLGEVMRDPNMHARGALLWQDHPEFGRIVVQRSALQFSGAAPASMEPSRPLGADNARLFKKMAS